MTITLPDLPYSLDALDPVISGKTLEFHHGKHHNAYVTNLNGLIAGTDLGDVALEDIIQTTAKDVGRSGVFNNAAQVWNHTFYWNSMKASGGGKPSSKIGEKINLAFGSYEAFVGEFKKAATTQFGSGWAWLVEDGDTLSIMKTTNADLPLAHGKKALLTIDVWEHAYYLDFQNRRPDYVSAYIDKLVNWDFAEQNLSK